MTMYAGEVKPDGEWDDDRSLGALLDNKISVLEFKEPPSESGKAMSNEDIKYNKRIVLQAQAEAIIEHIITNMVIKGINTKWNVGTEVEGETETAEPDNHSHALTLGVTDDDNVVFTQNNDGTGHVE